MRLFRNILVANILVIPSFLNGIENLHLEAKPNYPFQSYPAAAKVLEVILAVLVNFYFLYEICFSSRLTLLGSCDGHNALFKYFFSFLNSCTAYWCRITISTSRFYNF